MEFIVKQDDKIFEVFSVFEAYDLAETELNSSDPIEFRLTIKIDREELSQSFANLDLSDYENFFRSLNEMDENEQIYYLAQAWNHASMNIFDSSYVGIYEDVMDFCQRDYLVHFDVPTPVLHCIDFDRLFSELSHDRNVYKVNDGILVGYAF